MSVGINIGTRECVKLCWRGNRLNVLSGTLGTPEQFAIEEDLTEFGAEPSFLAFGGARLFFTDENYPTHSFRSALKRLVRGPQNKEVSDDGLYLLWQFADEADLDNVTAVEFPFVDSDSESVLIGDTQQEPEGAAAYTEPLSQEEMQPEETPDQTNEAFSLEDVVERAYRVGVEKLSVAELGLLQRSVAAEHAKHRLPPETGLQSGRVISAKPLANFLNEHSDPTSDDSTSIAEVVRFFGEATRMITAKNELTTSLKSSEWKVAKDVCLLGEQSMKQIEIKERFNNACQAIEELRELDEVTAKDLTRYFAKKHKAAKVHLKRTEGEVLLDEQKESLVELVDVFRTTGGIVKLDRVPCTLYVHKNKNMKQHRFIVKSADAVQSTLWSNIKVPSLRFSRK